jgi:threonine/homoserine/homoserine lactone efflux protein
MGQFAAFLGVAVLVIVTPGPDTAVTVRAALLGGRRNGWMTAAGVVSGQACWTVAASAGVAALLVASEPAFIAVKLAGAAYLAYLGAQALRAALRHDDPPAATAGTAASRTAYRDGLLSDLGNPKMAAFFTSLLPQFGSSFGTMVALGLTFAAMTWVWLALYSVAVARMRATLQRSRVRRAIEAVTGTVLIALGVRLATESRPA